MRTANLLLGMWLAVAATGDPCRVLLPELSRPSYRMNEATKNSPAIRTARLAALRSELAARRAKRRNTADASLLAEAAKDAHLDYARAVLRTFSRDVPADRTIRDQIWAAHVTANPSPGDKIELSELRRKVEAVRALGRLERRILVENGVLGYEEARQALLAELRENPADTTLLAIYADLLAECGDDLRSNFLRAHLRLAEETQEDVREELRKWVEAAHRDHESALTFGLSDLPGATVEFAGAFPREVKVPWAQFDAALRIVRENDFIVTPGIMPSDVRFPPTSAMGLWKQASEGDRVASDLLLYWRPHFPDLYASTLQSAAYATVLDERNPGLIAWPRASNLVVTQSHFRVTELRDDYLARKAVVRKGEFHW